MEKFRHKHFQDAFKYFQQVLTAEPRHTGAAYLLSLSYYFSGAFREAQHLFKQLLVPGNPLEQQQIKGLTELLRYSDYECARLDYWDGMKLENPTKISKELKRGHWRQDSLQGFHLYMANGLTAEWSANCRFNFPSVQVRLTDRNNKIRIFSDCQDADMTIGPHLEAVRGSSFEFIPFEQIRVLEFGQLKRWIDTEVLFKDGNRESLKVPLVYCNSMSDPARGVQEGVETVTRQLPGSPQWFIAFGQKKFKSQQGTIGLADLLSFEVIE
ncbi:MAG: type VI secretion system accessory protein TagJ [bacterium]|nr:type VI secretion system accessory protein TagJ [bacterium]